MEWYPTLLLKRIFCENISSNLNTVALRTLHLPLGLVHHCRGGYPPNGSKEILFLSWIWVLMKCIGNLFMCLFKTIFPNLPIFFLHSHFCTINHYSTFSKVDFPSFICWCRVGTGVCTTSVYHVCVFGRNQCKWLLVFWSIQF